MRQDKSNFSAGSLNKHTLRNRYAIIKLICEGWQRAGDYWEKDGEMCKIERGEIEPL